MKNSTKRKVLILSANWGKGHMIASKAIKSGIEHLYKKKYHIEIIDFFEFLNKTLNKVEKPYEELLKLAPSIYKFLFETTNKKWQVKFFNIINYSFCAQKIKKFLALKKPDIIISTFPFADYAIEQIKKQHYPNAKFLSVVTDSISIHHSWTIADADYHVVANNDTAASLKNLGIKEEKIKILGFPIRLDFLKPANRQLTLKELNLNPKLFTVLFLQTLTNVKTSLQILDELTKINNINIIVVTGANKKIKADLKKFTNTKNIAILGWTEKLPDLIKSCDLVITKAGGSTVMECIAAKKPMIITQIIPGHEMGNADLIDCYRLGIVLQRTNLGIIKSINHIRKNYSKFQENLSELSNPDAALKIAKFIDGI